MLIAQIIKKLVLVLANSISIIIISIKTICIIVAITKKFIRSFKVLTLSIDFYLLFENIKALLLLKYMLYIY